MQPEMITMGGNKVVSAGNEADWGREVTRSLVISAVRAFPLILHFRASLIVMEWLEQWIRYSVKLQV